MSYGLYHIMLDDLLAAKHSAPKNNALVEQLNDTLNIMTYGPKFESISNKVSKTFSNI